MDAAAAARSNLELVSDAYSRGAVSIIDLLDAQNAHIVADQASANAVYDFLLDLVALQRAVGRFDALMTPEARDDFMARLGTFMETETESEGP
jgi:outer membrane protein